MEEVEVLQQRVEQETQLRQDAIREAQEKETVLLAQVQQKSDLGNGWDSFIMQFKILSDGKPPSRD